ncbi:MAG: pyridoxamine 5'-phosphate oxidase family protein [Sulfitobacter sp.]
MHNALSVGDRMRDRGAVVVRDYMPDQHRDFFSDQQLVILSALDSKGHPWPFLRTGPQGFMTSPSAKELCITSRPTAFEKSDLNLRTGSKISVLGIEFASKRRNRLNGTITKATADRLEIAVDQSFGNCPRYIHPRDGLRRIEPAPIVSEGQQLTDADIDQIKAADSLFIASRAPEISADRRFGVDVNHRGGLPGFVHVTADRHLVIPDYDGNKFFNTLGNLLLDHRMSLMFFDFDQGNVLTLAGDAQVLLDVGEKSIEYGADRVIRVTPHQIMRAGSALPFRCELRSLSGDPPAPGLMKDNK